MGTNPKLLSIMPTALIVHGIYGNPEENWLPWLKQELEALGVKTYVPFFPTKDDLKPQDWWEAFEPYEKHIKADTILIGHSLGVAFLLKVLEKHAVRASFFVASAWGDMPYNTYQPVMAPIADQKFDWKRIRKHCPHVEIFHSDNDPYPRLERGETLAKNLGAKLTVIRGAGHFNKDAGYTTFPLLLERIMTICLHNKK
ncbi:MAG TPA: alpha/beta hydrolase [Candidatus Peribacteraceae bacterium]|nr:alpha/beta hydrolase [Candidatus Peribacteraceae bacterium]